MKMQNILLLVALLVGVNAVVGNKPTAGNSTTGATWLANLCTAIRANYVTLPDSPQPTCRLYVVHEGSTRFADVYFPLDYSASSEVPLWLHLHGLYRVSDLPPAASLLQPRQPLGQQELNHVKRAAEHVAGTWGSINGWLGKQAILVYPDASGKLPGFQMWNSGFWQCPYKTDPHQCVDGEVDDVGFLESVMQVLLDSLPSKPSEVYAMGFSNGGMMITRMLCQSEYLRSIITAATLASTVLKGDYLETACGPGQPQQPPQGYSGDKRKLLQESTPEGPSETPVPQQQFRKVPMLFIQGMADTLFPFYEGTASATGDVLLSTVEMVDAWAARYGCRGSAGNPPLVYLAGQGVACRDFCPSPEPAAAEVEDTDGSTDDQQPVIWLCAMEGQRHDWSPFMADLAWTFYTEHKQHTAALAQPDFPVWQVAGPRKAPAPAQPTSPEPHRPVPAKQQQQQAGNGTNAAAKAAAGAGVGKGTAAPAAPPAAPASMSSKGKQPAAASASSDGTTSVGTAPATAVAPAVPQQTTPSAAGNPSKPPGSYSSSKAEHVQGSNSSSSSSNSISSHAADGIVAAGKAASAAAAAAASMPAKQAGQAADAPPVHSQALGKAAGSHKH